MGRYQKLPGDWECPKCGELQFCGRVFCRSCGLTQQDAHAHAAADAKARIGPGQIQDRLAQWTCQVCQIPQRAGLLSCRKCGGVRPTTLDTPLPLAPWTTGLPVGVSHVVVPSTPLYAAPALAPEPTPIAPGGATQSEVDMLCKDWICTRCKAVQAAGELICRECDECRDFTTVAPPGVVAVVPAPPPRPLTAEDHQYQRLISGALSRANFSAPARPAPPAAASPGELQAASVLIAGAASRANFSAGRPVPPRRESPSRSRSDSRDDRRGRGGLASSSAREGRRPGYPDSAREPPRSRSRGGGTQRRRDDSRDDRPLPRTAARGSAVGRRDEYSDDDRDRRPPLRSAARSPPAGRGTPAGRGGDDAGRGAAGSRGEFRDARDGRDVRSSASSRPVRDERRESPPPMRRRFKEVAAEEAAPAPKRRESSPPPKRRESSPPPKRRERSPEEASPPPKRRESSPPPRRPESPPPLKRKPLTDPVAPPHPQESATEKPADAQAPEEPKPPPKRKAMLLT